LYVRWEAMRMGGVVLRCVSYSRYHLERLDS
jgi:hypothetical protein